jgi:hypothetical protein
MAVYLGQTLKNLQKKILIADLTESDGLHYLFSASEKFPITYRNVDYIDSRFQITAQENESYDYVFVCMRRNEDLPLANYLSKNYYISDTEYEHLKTMIGEMKTAKIATGIIIRDIPGGKFSVEYLLRCVFMDEYVMKLCETDRIYRIRADEADRQYRLDMQYGVLENFKELSPDYQKVLEKLAVELTGCSQKEAAKMVKYAKEGKNSAKHHILEQYSRKKRNKR